MTEKELIYLQNQIISWYEKNGRSFSWRNSELTSWQWRLLESLLKRTKAELVETMYISFINKYNTPHKILETNENELEADLRPIGLQKQRKIALSARAKR